MALNRARLALWLPFLGWPRPDRATLRGEIMAGLTVAMLVLPQGVAYAALAGMPLVTGIYASFIPALVGVLFSASARLSVGPTALTSLLIGASLGPLAVPGGADWVSLAVWLALMSGALQLLMGVMRFGWLLKLVNSPVLIGFTQGASVLIALSQLPALLGFTGRPMAQWLAGPPPDWTAMAFGLATMAILWTAKQRWPRLPAAMLVVGLGAVVSATLGYALRGGAVIGALPTGLPAPYLPGAISLQTFGALLLPALMITLVSFLETASSAKVDNSRSGKLWNENQDLIGQGLAKIASGLCGAFATSSSFSRSAINLYAGAKTGWATIVCVVLIGVALLWLMPLLYHVPQAVLAGLVVTAILGLVRPAAFVALWRVSRIEAGTAIATFALTIATAPAIYWGVLAGLAMSLSHYMYRHLHPRIIEVGLHPDGRLRDRHLWHLPPLREDVCALRMDAELDFASASTLERAVSEQLAAHPAIGTLCLFAQPINRIDITGAEVFGSIRQTVESRGLSLWVIGLKLPAQTVLEKAGLLTPGPMLRVFGTDAEALAALAEPAAKA
ncbi:MULTISPECIES: SulP family inorganic anion transporter [unclassified Variovorax]|uniref:SulP family inorganic anion transporter n=1 Tax=unclassified Variovorax TaxID=663243 RepID=UPI00257872BC|nr:MULTISPECIES: SulP family inorganic anion transporter [unclassified Variovorax]MDM0087933.1 SulP family inorganic anion transporter [Variovorax sp. J22G40]MDM0143811.1 SulP family inorganic anion transporter [Variovorax sp. J2P1-31]